MPGKFPVLHTPRLLLREIGPADAEPLFAIHSDPEVMRWYGVDPITSPAESSRLADMFAAWFIGGTGYRWALQRHEDGRLIGTCGLFRWNKSWRNCVTGYELGRMYQGQGYMREAMSRMLDYGFDDMQLHRIQAEVHPENAASIGLATRLGFRFEGVHREQAYWAGQYHDLQCYALLATDWRRDCDKPSE
jgi:ribosomal-protein-alanine N-acetyltransferase